MNLIVLGLKEKRTGAYFVYDVNLSGKHIPIKTNETKTIDILDPFPFSKFSSVDEFDINSFEKCYLEVDAELSKKEFDSMQSFSISYHRFKNRKITFLNEFEDIFQYSLKMLRKFGKNLGTYDLLTWVIHNEAKNELEFEAMKKIILSSVSSKENKKYPLDISLDIFTIKYIDYFRELSERGYNITFGRYGYCDDGIFEKYNLHFSNETFLYLIKNLHSSDYSFLEHFMFTPSFYEELIINDKDGIEDIIFYSLNEGLLFVLKTKGFDIDFLYERFFNNLVENLNREFYDYDNDFFRIFTEPEFEPYTEHISPLDNYCCEDCDGYDIYDYYDDEDLLGKEIVVNERVDYLGKLISYWSNFLSSKSFRLFDRVPSSILEQLSGNKFFVELLAHRKQIS